MNLNRAYVGGHLTRDPELKYTPSGAAVCEFSIAVNRRWTDKKSGEKKEDVSFFDLVAWSRTAELCAEHLKKGRAVFVEGRLQQDRWDDKATGQKRSRIRIVVERVHFLGPKDAAGTDETYTTEEERSEV